MSQQPSPESHQPDPKQPESGSLLVGVTMGLTGMAFAAVTAVTVPGVNSWVSPSNSSSPWRV